MKSKILLLAVPLATVQGCATNPTEVSMDINISIDKRVLNFESLKSSFSYNCLPLSQHEPGEVKARFSTKSHYAPTGYISIQETSTEHRKRIKLSQPESLESLASVNMFTAEINGIRGSDQTIYRYDNSIVEQFIEECQISTANELKIKIEQMERDEIQSRLKAKQHQNMVTTSINNALKKHNIKGVKNGGELAIQNVLFEKRHLDKDSYRSFLENIKTAYVIDFSQYVVKQSLGNNKYVLRHLIEDYYTPAITPPLAIILNTNKLLFEGETPSKSVVLYTGIELHQTVAGSNRQLVGLTTLD
ncbi:hypothetical protein AB6C57_14910 [Vibrio splendidus]